MDPSSLVWITTLIGQWFDRIRQMKTESASDQQNRILDSHNTRIMALRSLLTALNETKIYVGRIGAGKSRIDRKCEEKLSRLWMDAAYAIRDDYPELADACFEKSQHWAESEEWRLQMSEMDRARINLDIMSLRAKELLKSLNSLQ